MDHGDVAWILTSSALVFIMTPGLAFFYGGLVKRKNIINTIMSSVILMGIGSLLWVLIGFSLSFSGDGSIIGNLKWAGLSFDSFTDVTYPYPNTMAFALFQMMFASITPGLISGAVAERMKFSSLVIFTTIWSIIVYYPLAHMVWGGGFLSDIGSVDFAGGNVVHISSGVSALVLTLMLGKRKNFGRATYHPHNAPFVFLGAALLWFGWFGFNAGSALEANGSAALAMVNTWVATACATMSWMLAEWTLKGKPSMLGAASGAVAGMVAITPAAGFVGVMGAIVIGLSAGVVCLWGVNGLKRLLGADDSLDVFGVHGVGGILGSILTGIFCSPSLGGTGVYDYVANAVGEYDMSAQVISQLWGVGTAVVWSAIVSVIAYKLVDMVIGLRVPEEEEREGLDITSHGETAYHL